jgi:hypothetical protein
MIVVLQERYSERRVPSDARSVSRITGGNLAWATLPLREKKVK